jgi:hypothetical protein
MLCEDEKRKPMTIGKARLARVAVPAAALIGGAGLVALAGPAQQASAQTCTGAGTTVTCAFTTPGTTSWVVPSGVTSVTLKAIGGGGGNGDTSGALGGNGGLGAEASRGVAVTPGSTLTVIVGAHGANATSTAGGSGGAGASAGGAGGTGGTYGGGGGGGSSEVRFGGSVLITGPGGGGGGGGCVSSTTANGAGGNGAAAGSAGAACGGTAGSAGAAGNQSTGTGQDGAAGAAGAGGGGGGGALGGGGGNVTTAAAGGGSGGGGGGGSILSGSSLTGTLGALNADGAVYISYSASGTVSITTNRVLPNASIGHHYSTTLAASGGTGSYTWSRASGGLPRGLSLSSGGVISGTVNAYGRYSYTARVRDSAGKTATKEFSLQVLPKADLSIVLTHTSAFYHGHKEHYVAHVTNDGSAATSTAAANTIWFTGGSGIQVTFGGSGTGWSCRKSGNTSTCTRSGSIAAGATTDVTITVKVNSSSGRNVTSTAKVGPTDYTWGDNTGSDTAYVH